MRKLTIPAVYAPFLIVFALAAIGSVMTAPARVPTSGTKDLAGLAIGSLVCLTVLLLLRNIVIRAIGRFIAWSMHFSANQWMLICFGLGAVLRILFFVALPVEQYADQLAYWTIAQQFSRGEDYLIDTFIGPATRGLYPPGLPIILVPSILIFGADPSTLLIHNLVFLFIGIVSVIRLGEALELTGAARLAPLILVLWPNHISGAPLASKELVLAALIPIIVLLTRQAALGRGPRYAPLIAGFLLGVSTLVQPAIGVMGTALLCIDLIHSERWFSSLKRMAVVAIVAALTIAPWSIRNSMVFDKFVPLTTVGALTLFTGNNDFADGQFIPLNTYFPDWQSFDETELSDVAGARAIEWIGNNPAGFLKLTARRQIASMCCSDNNIFDAFWRGAQIQDRRYFIAAAAGWIFWVALLALILANIIGAAATARNSSSAHRAKISKMVATLVLPILIGFLLHSIVESGTRHMFLYAPLWCLLAGLIIEPTRVRPETSQAT